MNGVEFTQIYGKRYEEEIALPKLKLYWQILASSFNIASKKQQAEPIKPWLSVVQGRKEKNMKREKLGLPHTDLTFDLRSTL